MIMNSKIADAINSMLSSLEEDMYGGGQPTVRAKLINILIKLKVTKVEDTSYNGIESVLKVF
jgi:hypothetical protein